MDFSIQVDPKIREKYISVNEKGKAILDNPFTNKGTAFTECERNELDLQGLLPPYISSIEEQLARNFENFKAQTSDLKKYQMLTNLHDRNEVLYFRFLHEYIEEILPVIYTPTVGEACQKFSHIYRRGRGLYINYRQIDIIEKILQNFQFKDISVIVATDGERILGLGDQGADGMGIPIGKLSLYTLGAGIFPHNTLPVMLDVGTDNEERRNDPLYLGLHEKRIRGEYYQRFIDRFVEAVIKVFPNVLLQWEDLAKTNAIKQLNRFRDVLSSFNDDIQGTGSIVLAYLYGAMEFTKHPLRNIKVLFNGAGASAKGIADFIVLALREDGMSLEEAKKHIWMLDSKGLITKARPGLEDYKEYYARDMDDIAVCRQSDPLNITLLEAVNNVKPNVLIGTSAVPGAFSESIIKAMSEFNKNPIIFPLSNPTNKSECTAEDAVCWSGGKAIVATGSPFPDVEFDGLKHRTSQCNNFFIFPGFGLGITAGRIRCVTDGMFIAAAKALSKEFKGSDSEQKSLILEPRNIRKYSHAIACGVIRQAVSEGYASPEILTNLEETVLRTMWFPEYLPVRYHKR